MVDLARWPATLQAVFDSRRTADRGERLMAVSAMPATSAGVTPINNGSVILVAGSGPQALALSGNATATLPVTSLTYGSMSAGSVVISWISADQLKLSPLASLVPMMRPVEWTSFLEDVRVHGIQDPLHVAPDGVTVLDGRHRRNAALELGLTSVPVMPAPLNGHSEMAYMLRRAVLRRHLTDDQRAILAAQLYAESSSAAKRGRAAQANAVKYGDAETSLLATVSDKEKIDTRATAAREYSVSERKVKYAIELVQQAPDLAQQVRSGTLRLHEALTTAKRQALAASAPALDELDAPVTFLHGDFREVGATIADGSVDLILTDPPYGKEFLPLWPARQTSQRAC
jgi:ParB-like chromosome segregation protein Spo0J